MRHKRFRQKSELPELDVTPFMNLMIVLVPVLLLSLVFTHTAVIELDFPASDAVSVSDEKPIYLEVQILPDGLRVADQNSVIKKIPLSSKGDYDYQALSLVMQGLKQKLPTKRDATILLSPKTEYQTLVSVMDGVRHVSMVVGGKRVQQNLFPDLSLGDIPDSATNGEAG